MRGIGIDSVCMRVLSRLPEPWDVSGVNLREALFYSLQLGHKETSMALLKGNVVLCPVLFKSIPPLHLAAGCSDLDAIRHLVGLDRASLARRCVMGRSALLHAAAEGRHASVVLLRELGAKTNGKNDLLGSTMRNYAARWLEMGGAWQRGGAVKKLVEGSEAGKVWRKLLDDEDEEEEEEDEEEDEEYEEDDEEEEGEEEED